MYTLYKLSWNASSLTLQCYRWNKGHEAAYVALKNSRKFSLLHLNKTVMSLKGTVSRDFYFFHLPICLAMRVLPVPGGPNSRIPFTCLQPSCSIISGGNTRDAKARLKICSIVSGTRQSAQQKTLHMYAPQLLHNLRRKNHCFESRSGWIRAVSSIRIRVWKVRIRPNINSCDLTDGFDKVLDFGGTWPKKTVLRVLDMKYSIFFYLYR